MTLNGIEAVIFDLDGTIVDSEPLHEAVFYDLFEELGHKDDHGIDFQKYYGTSDRAVWVDFTARYPQQQSIDDLLAWKQERFLELALVKKPVFPGVAGLVFDLAEKYIMGLASGSRHEVINAMLDMSGLNTAIPKMARVSSQDVVNGKPSPDIFLLAAEKIGVAPGKCCAIEDSVFGVTAANEAGMKSIAITNTFSGEKLSHAWQVVRDYESIRRLLLDGF